MAGNFTFEQFEQAANNAGLLNTFSTADIDLAKKNPSAGMDLLQHKIDYGNATTDEQRAQINAKANATRSGHGGYTAGSDGSSFYLDPLSPSSFQTAEAPKYVNRYDSKIQDAITDLVNYEAFKYNAATDPLYSQYRKQYAREGQRATADTLAKASAATGGIPSSYAVTAAAQAGNYYSSQMADKIPELYELAYNKYLNDYNMQQGKLSILQGAEQNDYNKYLNDLAQYNTDRSFNYSVLLDEIESQAQERQEALNKAAIGYSLGDNRQYEALGYDLTNDPAARERALNEAAIGYSLGDNSKYEALGFDLSNDPVARERQWSEAITKNNYGDASGLEALGVDMSNDPATRERVLNEALTIAAQTGDTSYLKALGIDVSNMPTEWDRNLQLAVALNNAGDPSLLKTISQSIVSSMGVDANASIPVQPAKLGADTGGNDSKDIKVTVGLTGSDLATLSSLYPTKVIPKQEMQSIVQSSGGKFTEQDLINAGFTTGDAIKSITTYEQAVSYLGTGNSAGLLTQNKWAHDKAQHVASPEFTNFDTYADYVQAFVRSAVGATA